MLGPDRAEIVDESQSAISASPTSMCGEEVFQWPEAGEEGHEDDERRPSNSSINTIIISAEELESHLKRNLSPVETESGKQGSPGQLEYEVQVTGSPLGEDKMGVVYEIPVVRIHKCE